jgi:hypothetical protein
MSIFAEISAFIKGAVNKISKTSFQRPAILQEMDTTQTAVQTVYDEASRIETIKLLEGVARKIKMHAYKSPTDRQVLAVYETYRKALGAYTVKENKLYLGAIVSSVNLIMTDLDKLFSQALQLFSDLKDKEDLRVSHSYILGYLHLAEMTSIFFGDMLYLLDVPNGERPPKYLFERVEKYAAPVGKFINMLLIRPGTITILADINELRKGGTDIYMSSDDSHMNLEDYAHDADYSSRVQTGLSQGFIGNPFIMIGDAITVWQRQRYERNKKHREWISAKIAILQMDLDGVDPNSSDYKKQLEIIRRYTDELATLDKKINQYENT